MSNQQLWKKTIEDFQTIVDSARYSIPLEEMFDDDTLYRPIREAISDFDLASWLMFDTLENRDTTTHLIREFWRQLHRMRGLEHYLERLFDSYLGIYRVNYRSEDGLYVQNMVFREHAIIVDETEVTEKLDEGDVFFGRIVRTDVGNFVFYVDDAVSAPIVEDFTARVESMLAMQPQLEQDPEGYRQSLKDGNPDLMFLYALGIQRSEDEESDRIFTGWDEEEEESGIYGYVSDVSKDADEAVRDTYVLEGMESSLLIDEGVSFESERFTDYDRLLEGASKQGDFEDDEQLLRIARILIKWLHDEPTDEARAAAKRINANLLRYKANLEHSVTGLYRQKVFDQAIREEGLERIPWIMLYDRYLDSFLSTTMEATQTGALNRKSLDRVLPLIGVMAEEGARLREGNFPELVLFRKFAELKGLIVREENRFQTTTRLEHYRELDQGEKLALWLSTLLDSKLQEVDSYFSAWPIGIMWPRLRDGDYLERLLTVPKSPSSTTRIQAITVQMGQDMGIYRLNFDGSYRADFSKVGQAVLRYLGYGRGNNVTRIPQEGNV